MGKERRENSENERQGEDEKPTRQKNENLLIARRREEENGKLESRYERGLEGNRTGGKNSEMLSLAKKSIKKSKSDEKERKGKRRMEE